jgi:hypothetical protein
VEFACTEIMRVLDAFRQVASRHGDKRDANNLDLRNGQSLGRFAHCLDRYLAVDISGVLWYVDPQVYVVCGCGIHLLT